MIIVKNRNRSIPTFANINLFGNCNVNCFFCLGKDLQNEFSKFNHTKVHFSAWKNLDSFINECKINNIKNIYITGQNTDSLMYLYIDELIDYLQNEHDFYVGVRTNGYLASKYYSTLQKCKRSVGFSIHSLDSETNYNIMRRKDIPDWNTIIPNSGGVRINRYNEKEVLPIIKYASSFSNVSYIQIRRVSTDHRLDLLNEDQEAFKRLLDNIHSNSDYLRVDDFYGAPQYMMFGKKVCWWATISTSISSFNYYTDGTINKDYFVIEGYEKSNGFYDPKS